MKANAVNEVSPPEGYKKRADGALIPEGLISAIDLARDEFVQEVVSKAKAQHAVLKAFKEAVFGDVRAFVEMSANQYNVSLGGRKGNLTLMSFDGRYKVQMAVSERLTFDERLQVARELVNQCIHAWSESSRDEIKALVNDAFQVDQEGKLNTGRILGLRKLEIKDERWLQAMEAISQSVQVCGSKEYIRFYERVADSDQYNAISLDLAAL